MKYLDHHQGGWHGAGKNYSPQQFLQQLPVAKTIHSEANWTALPFCSTDYDCHALVFVI